MRPSTGRRRGGGTSPARSTRSRPWWCGRSVAWQVTSGMADRPHTQRPRRRLAFASSAIRTCAWSRAAVTSRSQPAVDARSSTERVVTIIRNRGSLLVLCIVWPLPRSVRPVDFSSRTHSPAHPRVDPGVDHAAGDGDGDDPMMMNARTGARLGAKYRSRAGKLAGDIDPPRCLDPARPAQSGTPVGSSSEPADPTRKDRSRAINSCMLQRTLRAGVDAAESEPRRRALPPRSTSRSSACRELLRGTASRLVREGARRRMRGCIRPRLRVVDVVGADRRQGVDGLGDEPVDGARCRSGAL